MVVALYLDYRSYYGITMHSNQYQNKLKDKHPITINYLLTIQNYCTITIIDKNQQLLIFHQIILPCNFDMIICPVF